MRRAIGQSLRIGVSSQAVSLLRISRWHGSPVTVLAEHALAPAMASTADAVAQALPALLGELKLEGWPVSFVLADELTRLWQVTPPAAAARMADLEAAAALRFQRLYGEPLAAWQMSADWNLRQPFFAAAVPRILLDMLQRVAQECRMPVMSIEPHFVSAWNRWHKELKPGAWFALMHDNLLTVALFSAADKKAHANLLAVRTHPVPHGADHQWLTQMLAREALLHNIEPPVLLQICGNVPAAWTPLAGNSIYVPCEALEQAGATMNGDMSTAVLLAYDGGRR